MGGGGRQEQLALGETPNVAARLQGLAAPNTVVISAATHQLLEGYLCLPVLRHPSSSKAWPRRWRSIRCCRRVRPAVAWTWQRRTGLTPLVGREQEVALLLERWAQVKDGLGQVVLLSGEAGIGKSRLVQVLTGAGGRRAAGVADACQCSPYHQHTALYPVIELLQRVPALAAGRGPRGRSCANWRGSWCSMACRWQRPCPSLPPSSPCHCRQRYAPLTLSPQQQKQKTLHALLTILLRIAAQQPVLFVMEDLHWVDPSTLELLSLLVDQGPTARILALLTCRPDFSPPWTPRSHLTQLTLQRLPRRQVDGDDRPGGRRQGAARRGASSRWWPRPMGCRCLSRS